MRRQRIACADGFTVSVQASKYHYCRPRSDEGPWTHYELGFPSRPVPSLNKYKDNDTPDESSIFAYVTKEDVKQLLRLHAGLAADIVNLGTAHGLGLGSDV